MKIFIIIFFYFDYLFCQLFIPADPFYLISQEQKNYSNYPKHNLFIRPLVYSNLNKWNLKIRNEMFYNVGAPNLENMGNKFIGRGFGSFLGLNVSFSGKFIFFSLEPFYFLNQNKEIEDLNREGPFDYLNDVQNTKNSPFTISGFREVQFYFTYKKFGLGISNSNMWWGPGLHTSLNMSNNTTGFPHFLLGTLEEKRYKNIGYNFKYIFSHLNKTNNNLYYTSFVSTITFYTSPIITIGLNRNILIPTFFENNNISKFNAATILFRTSNLLNNSYQTLSAFIVFDFPSSRSKIFFELGSTDKWKNYTDFINYPDHGIGSIFGFRQYGPFKNKNFVMGFEYARLVQSSYWSKRPTIDWYSISSFNFSSYDDRRWAAHSGSDSDDLYIYFGFQSDEWSFIPSLNYERHGVLYTRPPEVKMEIRFDLRYNWKEYHFNIFYEHELLEHAGFVLNKWRNGNVVWFGIERDISNVLSKK